MTITVTGNLHSVGAIPTVESARQLGYDVRFVETPVARRRRYEAFDTDGSVLGEVGDDNYVGFQTESQALLFLAQDTGFRAAVASQGGVCESEHKSAFVRDDGHGNKRIDVNFTYGEELSRP